jgi:hypothetical protein
VNGYDNDTGDAGRWIIAALLALAVIAFIAFVSLAQATSESAGERIMARTANALSEMSGSVATIEPALKESAGQSEADPVRVPNYPLAVDLSREEALSLEGQQLGKRILELTAEQMYDDGVSVFDDNDPEAQQSISTGSEAGAIRAALSVIGGTPRLVFLALAIVSGLAALALASVLTIQMGALRRLIALGVVLLASGAAAAVVVLLIRLATGSIGDGAFGDELSDIAVDAQGVGLRNCIVVTVLGAALLVLGVGGSLLESRENGPNGPPY